MNQPTNSLRSLVDTWEAQLAAQTSDDAFLEAWSEVLSAIRGHAATDVNGIEGRLALFQRRYLALSESREAEHLLSIDARSERTLASQAQAGFGRSVFDRLADLPELVDLNRCRRVVVVGCGALPAAAFVIHDATSDTRVSALEIDRATAEVAQRVALRHGSSRLEVLNEDGCDHDFAEAGVVFVANQATPKPEILARIAATAPADVAVVLREPAGVGRLLADALDQPPYPWKVVANGPTDQRFLSHDVLLAQSA
jgi:hypothetical protein